MTGYISNESKNMGILTWVLTFLCALSVICSVVMPIPALIIIKFKQSNFYVVSLAKEALNFGITIIVVYPLIVFATFIFKLGVFPLVLVWLFSIVISAMGIYHACNGRIYKPPFTLRLIK